MLPQSTWLTCSTRKLPLGHRSQQIGRSSLWLFKCVFTFIVTNLHFIMLFIVKVRKPKQQRYLFLDETFKILTHKHFPPHLPLKRILRQLSRLFSPPKEREEDYFYPAGCLQWSRWATAPWSCRQILTQHAIAPPLCISRSTPASQPSLKRSGWSHPLIGT